MLHQLTSDLAATALRSLDGPLHAFEDLHEDLLLFWLGQCIKRTLRIIGRLVTRDD
jgi:hypothetical protein